MQETERGQHQGAAAWIEAASVVRDPAVWPRLATDEDRVAYFRDVFDDLPPIVVEAGSLRLIDGWHRLEAALRLGRERLRADVVEPPADGVLAAALAYATRTAKPLTREERRHAIGLLLKRDPRRSDRWLAATVGVSHATVAAVRLELEARSEVAAAERRIGRDGVERTRPPLQEPHPTRPQFGQEFDGFDSYDERNDHEEEVRVGAPREPAGQAERPPFPATAPSPVAAAEASLPERDQRSEARRYLRDLLDQLSAGLERYPSGLLLDLLDGGAPGYPPERIKRVAAAWGALFTTVAGRP